MVFLNREDAGRQLAALLQGERVNNPLVLALPRGGVPVAYEVARELVAPLEVLVVRKLGAPEQPELGVGAIAEGGGVFIDRDAVKQMGITSEQLARVAERESVELARRVQLYRQGRLLPAIAGRTVLLVDDGVATGGSVRAAIQTLRRRRPRRLVLAAPVIAAATLEELQGLVDEVVCVEAPQEFGAVGFWYQTFRQTTDDEVLALLGRLPAAGAEHSLS